MLISKLLSVGVATCALSLIACSLVACSSQPAEEEEAESTDSELGASKVVRSIRHGGALSWEAGRRVSVSGHHITHVDDPPTTKAATLFFAASAGDEPKITVALDEPTTTWRPKLQLLDSNLAPAGALTLLDSESRRVGRPRPTLTMTFKVAAPLSDDGVYYVFIDSPPPGTSAAPNRHELTVRLSGNHAATGTGRAGGDDICGASSHDRAGCRDGLRCLEGACYIDKCSALRTTGEKCFVTEECNGNDRCVSGRCTRTGERRYSCAPSGGGSSVVSGSGSNDSCEEWCGTFPGTYGGIVCHQNGTNECGCIRATTCPTGWH